MKELPLLPTEVNGVASGMNNLGQAVGASNESNGTPQAVIWQNGTVTDLNTRLLDTSSPLFLALAQSINDRGEITGFCVDSTNGEVLAFVAVPVAGGDENSDGEAAAVRQRFVANFVIPENARRQMARRLPFSFMGRSVPR